MSIHVTPFERRVYRHLVTERLHPALVLLVQAYTEAHAAEMMEVGAALREVSELIQELSTVMMHVEEEGKREADATVSLIRTTDDSPIQ